MHDIEEMDVTLRYGRLVSMFLAGWLIDLAENPDRSRIRIVSRDRDHALLELQDETGAASGGIVFCEARGAVHVSGALVPGGSGRTKPRSVAQMRASLEIALQRSERNERVVRLHDYLMNPFFLISVAMIVGLLLWARS